MNDQLEAIRHHIQLIKEEARAEENTKEMVSDISLHLKTRCSFGYMLSVLMQMILVQQNRTQFCIRCQGAVGKMETLLISFLISKMELDGLIKKELLVHGYCHTAVYCTYPKRMRKKLNSFLTMKKSWKHAWLCRIKDGLVKL